MLKVKKKEKKRVKLTLLKAVLVAIVAVVVIAVVVAALSFPIFFRAREKACIASLGAPGIPSMPDAGGLAMSIPGESALPQISAPPPAAKPGARSVWKLGSASATRTSSLPPNAYYSSTYLGGSGARERIEKLIEEGVVIGGKKVKLEAFPREYKQSFPIPTSAALGLSAELERTKIISEGGSTYLQVGLQAIKTEAPRRPQLNLALVIDRSGSMGDENKLEYVKDAAIRLVERLRPTDVLSLVVYDDAASVAVPAQKVKNKAQFERVISSLTHGGSTNIYDALRLGYQEVRKNYNANSVNCVLLLSDGIVTAGVSDPAAFQQLANSAFDRGIHTTTIGVGVEFDEQLMLSLAQAGKGNYHFIKDATSADRILKQEFDELTHIVAKALKVRIVLDRDVKLLKVFGSQQLSEQETKQVKAEEKKIDRRVYEELGIRPDRQKEPEEPGIKIFIPHFYRGSSHVIILQVELPKGNGKRKVADVYVNYKDLVFRTNRKVESDVWVNYVQDKDSMIASINRSVKKNVLGLQTGEVLIQAAQLIERGEYSQAAKLIDEQMVLLGVAAKEWGDPDLDRDGLLLAKYRDVIREVGTVSATRKELGEYLKKSLTYAGYQRSR